jgi:hypothetical protein
MVPVAYLPVAQVTEAGAAYPVVDSVDPLDSTDVARAKRVVPDPGPVTSPVAPPSARAGAVPVTDPITGASDLEPVDPD